MIRIGFDVGDGPEAVEIRPRAVIAWELATKQKMSQLANGLGMTDLSIMLWEQIRITDPDRFPTRRELVDAAVYIDPIKPANANADGDPLDPPESTAGGVPFESSLS